MDFFKTITKSPKVRKFPVFFLLAILVLEGCARSPGALPKVAHEEFVTIRVFCDGFHSGLVLPRVSVPWDLEPSALAWQETRAGRSFHYGEQAWTSGEDMSRSHAIRLVFVPGTGVIQSDVTPLEVPDIPGTDPARMRVCSFPASRTARDAVFLRLRTEWMAEGAIPRLAGEGEPSHLIASRRDWSVWWNCHDFTADLLRAAGLDLPSHTIATAGVLMEDLDLATKALAGSPMRVIGPP